MRVITLTQPWATLVAHGAKRIETRSWATPYRGPIAIHAGAGLARMSREDYVALCRSRPHFGPALWRDYPEAGFVMRNERGRKVYNDPLPRGAIVAVAELSDVLPTAGYGGPKYADWVNDLSDQERAFGDYGPGRYAWLLDNVRPLRMPLPFQGAQGLRPLDQEIVDDVLRNIV